jgi:signal transduction histidine kinase
VSFLADVRFVRAYIALGLAAVVAYHWVPGNAAYWSIALYGAAGVLLGALRLRRGDRLPWLVLAGGIALMVSGDIAWEIDAAIVGTPSTPNISDAFYLVGYPVFAAALVMMTRRASEAGLGTAVDSAIIALTFATVLWPALFATFAESSDQSLGARLTVGTYPCWDLLFLLLSVRIALTRAMHTRRMLLLIGAIALFLIGDLFWFDSVNTYALGDWMDFAWLGAYVGFGAAALHPSAISRGQTAPVTPFQRYLALGIPVALMPTAIVVEGIIGHHFTIVDGVLMSALLFLLVGRLGTVVRGLGQVERELSEQNRLKDELISVVSHDLRTPLTSIMGYLELALAEDTDPDTGRRFLEVVQRNTGRLHRLVEDLLFVSRVHTGKEALDLAPVDVAQLVRETVASARPSADGAEIALDCDAREPAWVSGDAHRLAEVLENLVSNALKFTPPGGRVRVAASADGETVTIEVSDTGVGIADDDRRHLFDRFFRAAGTDGIPGAGLGLSIVKAIVDAHEGRIEVASAVGAGTTFVVRLPAGPDGLPLSGDAASTLVRMA